MQPSPLHLLVLTATSLLGVGANANLKSTLPSPEHPGDAVATAAQLDAWTNARQDTPIQLLRDEPREAHAVGAVVPAPSPSEVVLIGNQGDTMLLRWAVNDSNNPHLPRYHQIVYQQALGQDTARVVYREISSRLLDEMAVGRDGVLALETGRRTDQADIEDVSFAKHLDGRFDEQVGAHHRPTAEGLLCQAERAPTDTPSGAIYYAPRWELAYDADIAVRLAPPGFAELNDNTRHTHTVLENRDVLVLLNETNTRAAVLELDTRRCRVLDLPADPANPHRFQIEPQLDTDRLLLPQGLYSLATGEQLAEPTRDAETGSTRGAVYHGGVCYAWAECVVAPAVRIDRGHTIPPLRETRLIAYPLEAGPSHARTLATFHWSSRDAGIKSRWTGTRFRENCFAGHNALVYSDGERWVIHDWMSPADFEPGQR